MKFAAPTMIATTEAVSEALIAPGDQGRLEALIALETKVDGGLRTTAEALAEIK